jgi:DNA-binding NtrC family response regulator
MPIELQAKLLRVLQNGEVIPVGGRDPVFVDVRVITATHRDLDRAVTEGIFREDLLYRLRVIPIVIPPLRQRKEDIRTLAEFFTHRYSSDLARQDVQIAEATLDRLESHDWPGNVRELENAIKRVLVLTSTPVLSPEDFDFLAESSALHGADLSLEDLVERETQKALDEPGSGELHRRMIGAVERPLLATVLRHTEGNQIKAAALLGINRNTLRKKIGELGVNLGDRAKGE